MSASNTRELDSAAVNVLRPQIFDVLSKSDISLVSAKKVRLALAEYPESERAQGVDYEADKKAIYALVRQCYDEYVKKEAQPKGNKRASAKTAEKPKKKRVVDEEEKQKRANRPNPLNRLVRLSDTLAEVCGGNEVRALLTGCPVLRLSRSCGSTSSRTTCKMQRSARR